MIQMNNLIETLIHDDVAISPMEAIEFSVREYLPQILCVVAIIVVIAVVLIYLTRHKKDKK